MASLQIADIKYFIKLKLETHWKKLLPSLRHALQYRYIVLVTVYVKLAVCSYCPERHAVRQFNLKDQLIFSETLFSKYRSWRQPTKCKNLSKTNLLSRLTVEIRQSMSHTSSKACMNLIPCTGAKWWKPLGSSIIISRSTLKLIVQSLPAEQLLPLSV